MYGNKFLDMWRDTDSDLVKQLWAEEMGKLSNEELKRGYNALMTREWPPSLPEYVKMCKPSIDPTVAYYEAVNGSEARSKGEMGKWAHPAIFWASVQISAFDLKNQTYSQLKTRWEKALADEMEKGQWEPIPQPMIALPAPGKSKTDKEEATRMLAQLEATGVLKNKGSDHRAWIKKILERQKVGDKNLPDISIRFAKEAMNETKTN